MNNPRRDWANYANISHKLRKIINANVWGTSHRTTTKKIFLLRIILGTCESNCRFSNAGLVAAVLVLSIANQQFSVWRNRSQVVFKN